MKTQQNSNVGEQKLFDALDSLHTNALAHKDDGDCKVALNYNDFKSCDGDFEGDWRGDYYAY
jgi:hypothetical protein